MHDRQGEANVLLNLGISHDYLNRSQQADAFYQQALLIAQSLKDLELEASFRQLIVSTTNATRRGHYQESLASDHAIDAFNDLTARIC